MATGAEGEEVRTKLTYYSNLLLTYFESLGDTFWKLSAFEKTL